MGNRELLRYRRAIALALSLAMLISITGCKKEDSPPTEQYMVVVDANDAIEQLAKSEANCGYENALSELTEKSTSAIDGDSYYRFQQNYEGIPVYGRTLVYVIDEKGNTISITGNVQDVDETINLTPTISNDIALSVVNQFFTDTFGSDAMAIDSLDLEENDLRIFVGTADQKSRLAYAIVLNGYELVIDAHDAALLQSNCLLRWATVQDLVGQETSYDDVEITEEDGEYRLTDEIRKLSSFQASHTEISKLWGLIKYQVNINNDADEIVWQDGGNPPADAVDAYVNAQIAYDYFDQVLGNTAPDGEGLGQVLLLTGIQYIQDDDGEISSGRMNNAASGTDLGGKATLLYFGVGTDGNSARSAYIDWVAHEYMHSVEAYHSSMIYHGESGAIMEGLSDIFGELVESWSTRQDPNWIFSETDRNMRDPGSGGYPASINDKNRSNEDYVHGYSTVVSHAAYLMWNGIDGNDAQRLSTEELAELWYRAVLMMPSDCDFILCRQLVEVAAQSMETLSDEQRECVREAFNCVGIPSMREGGFYPDYRLNRDATLTVYDQNNEPYSGYTLQINGTIDMSEIASNMTPDIGWIVNRTSTVEDPGAYALDLPQGRYMLTITDHYYDESYTIYVEINNDHTETNIDLITAYEEPLVVVIPELDYENLVSDAFSDYGICNDGSVNNYRIPKINIAGEAAEQTNAVIFKELYNGVYEKIENKRGQCGSSGITYSWTESNGIVSILARWAPEDYTGHGPIYFETYNASSKTGELLSLEQVAQAYNLTLDEFYALAEEKIENQFLQINGQFEEMEWAKEYYDQYLSEIRSDEYIKGIKPFVSENGDLCVVTEMYYVGVMACGEELINLSGDSTPEAPAFYWVIPEEKPEETNPDEPQNSGVTGEHFIGTVTEPDAGAIVISTAQELVDKITADPTGNYILACDIDLST